MTKFGKLVLLGLLIILAGVGYLLFGVSPKDSLDEQSITDLEDKALLESESDLYSISAEYPKTDNESINSDASLLVLGLVGDFKKEYEDLSPEDIEVLKSGAAGKHSFDLTYEEKSGDGFTSYVFNSYQYTGGAHGNIMIKTLNYDQAQNKIEIEDIVKNDPQNIAAISAIAQEKILSEIEGQIFSEGVSPDLENFENFYFKDGNLVFIFPPYQVAAYVEGLLEIEVPLSEIFGYLKRDYFESYYEEEKEFRGNILFGGEVRAFSYCEGEKEYWYQDTTGSLEDEYLHAKRSENAYEEVPVILRGYLRDVPEEEDGFAAEYDGILVVSDLDQVGGGGVCE